MENKKSERLRRLNESLSLDAPSWKEMTIKILPYLRPADRKHTVYSALALLAVILQKSVNVLPPLAIKLAVDIISENAAKEGHQHLLSIPIRPIVTPILVYFGLKMLSKILSVVQNLTKSNVSLDAERRFGVELFSHLHRLSLSYHLENHIGEVTMVLNRGVGSLSTFIDVFLFSLVPTLFEAVLVSAVFWKLGTPLIAGSTILAVALYMAFTIVVTSTRIRYRRKQIEASQAVGKKETETLVNYETVAMFGKSDQEIEKYGELRRTYQNCRIEMLGVFEALSFGQELIKLVGICLGLIIAAVATVRRDPPLSPGSFVVVQMYINQLFQPLTYISWQYRQVTSAFTDLEKAVVMLSKVPEVQDAPDATVWDPAAAAPKAESSSTTGSTNNQSNVEVNFENVSFHYKSSSTRKALGASLTTTTTAKNNNTTKAPNAATSVAAKNDDGDDEDGEASSGAGGVVDLTLRVRAGHTVALVGRSGSGKTTLMRLMLRMYDCDSGVVRVAGQDVKTLTQNSLRRNIGVVAQDTVLFNDTLRNNILYGKDDATEEELWNAVRTAALEEFVAGLPDKLDTVVGERGLKLSGGERQRVGLARCVIRSPQLILLDEATSALDSGTELEIQNNIARMCKNKTTVMIAHRLSTARNADEIVVLEKGRIVERGPHNDLLAVPDGRYAKMWRDQTQQQPPSSSEIPR